MRRELDRVLVLNIGGIGDMVMTTPAFALLAEHVKGGRFDILTVKRSAEVIEKADFIRRVYTIDVSFFTGRVGIISLFLFLKSVFTLIRLRLNRYDYLVDFMAVESERSAMRRRRILKVINAKRCSGRNTNGWAGYLDIGGEERLFSHVHEVKRKMSVLDAMGIKAAAGDIEDAAKINDMAVFTDYKDKSEADSILDSLLAEGEMGAGIAALIPGAYRPNRRWDRGGFIEVGRYLQDRYGLTILLFGVTDEKEVICEVSDGISGAYPLFDIPTRVIFEVFKSCAIVVTNDTGPMHIAAAAKRPGIVALFGADTPLRYGPYGEGLVSEALYTDEECSPCTLYDCERMDCLRGINVDMVKGAVDTIMGRDRERGRFGH